MIDEDDGVLEAILFVALKDWAASLMQFGMTREEAWMIVLSEIKETTERVQADYEQKKKGGCSND